MINVTVIILNSFNKTAATKQKGSEKCINIHETCINKNGYALMAHMHDQYT